MSNARKQITLYLSPLALAKLDARTASASLAAGVPVPRALVAAALLHGGLGLAPDGGELPPPPLPELVPPPSPSEPLPPVAPAREALPAPLPSPEAPPEAAPALATCSRCGGPGALDSAGAFTCSRCGEAEPPRLPEQLPEGALEILSPQEGEGEQHQGREEPPGPKVRRAKRATPGAVLSTFRTLTREKDPEKRRALLRGYAAELQQRAGLSTEEARAFLLLKETRRKLRFAIGELD